MAGLWYFMDILLECALAYRKLLIKNIFLNLGVKEKFIL